MGSKNELVDLPQLSLEGQLIPKKEPLDVDFIKKEEIEDHIFVDQGIVESTKFYEDSIKEEILEVEGCENSSSSAVGIYSSSFFLTIWLKKGITNLRLKKIRLLVFFMAKTSLPAK